jgi:hypothetical protein
MRAPATFDSIGNIIPHQATRHAFIMKSLADISFRYLIKECVSTSFHGILHRFHVKFRSAALLYEWLSMPNMSSFIRVSFRTYDFIRLHFVEVA